VRAFRAVGGSPIFFRSSDGAFLTDVDGHRYVDFVSSWGAVILGHSDDRITHAVADATSKGTSFGASHEGEVLLAREVHRRMPAVERVRFVNSGTEAALAVLRLARAATGRDKIIKFEGNYHGAVDALLAKAGSGVATFGLPDSAGVPAETAAKTLVARYNDCDHVCELLEANSGEVAAIIVEPVAGNMGLVPPASGFLQGLRALADSHQSLLIIDEVMTGFRVAPGGATELYGLKPDLVMMGKVIGGGLPVGAYGGRKELMELMAPIGPVYQAGTLSGNPLAMAAGYAALAGLNDKSYQQLEAMGARLQAGLADAAQKVGVPVQVQRVGSMISVFFAKSPVRNYADAQASDKALFGRVFHAMLARGVYLPPSALESWFLNLGHREKNIDHTVTAFEESLREAVA
jgi:glutamate-1-semialdehyde 2,1-aminomutase